MHEDHVTAHERQYQLTTEFYDIAFKNKPDIKFYTSLAKEMGGPVLEAACGTGRILLPIAAEGIEITGFDLSATRLKACEKKMETLADDVKNLISLRQLNMIDFNIKKKFRLAIIPFRGFQHLLDAESQLDALKCIGKHLINGGYLVFDIFNPSIPMLASTAMLEEFWEGDTYIRANGEEFEVWGRILERNYNEQTMLAQEIYIVNRMDGSREKFEVNYQFRYTFRYEIEHLLKLAGYVVEDVFSDFNKSSFGSTYPGDLVIFARMNN